MSRIVCSLAVVLAGCGGSSGSGGGGPGIAMQFSPATLTATFKQGDVVQPMTVTATLSQSPNQQVWLSIDEPEQVLSPNDLSIQVSGNGTSASATFHPSCRLDPGVHSGVLTVNLCKDSACSNRLAVTGNTLPYTFTVQPGTVVTAKLDGVAQPGVAALCDGPGLNFSAKVGQTVTLTATGPVTWSYFPGGFGNSYPTVTNLVQTSTTWTGTIGVDSPYGPPASGTKFGSIDVSAAPASAPRMSIPVGIDIYAP